MVDMDKLPETHSERREEAISAVGDWLTKNSVTAEKLTATQLQYYHGRNFCAGWRMQLEGREADGPIDLLLSEKFPWAAPRIALVDRSQYLIKPHIEADGLLCLLPTDAEVDPTQPVAVVLNQLSEAAHLLEEIDNGGRDDDFRSEFNSYWLADHGAVELRSLLEGDYSSRNIKVWRGEKYYVVGNNEDDLVNWLNNSAGEVKVWDIDDAFLVWLEKALLPKRYPKNVNDLLSIVESVSQESRKNIEEMMGKGADRVVIVLGAETANGVCFAGTSIRRRQGNERGKGRYAPDPVTKGFRSGNVPQKVVQNRVMGGAKLYRHAVQRVDAAWIHGRDADARQKVLRACSVALVGCGSVGSPTAVLLAQAGVGQMMLIDGKPLSWSNVGRHTLGAESVKGAKAAMVAARLARSFPHTRVSASRARDWEEMSEDERNVVASADLILSTTGSWTAEGALNDWHLKRGRTPAMLYGWTEPHAVAGHAVAILQAGGCFACNLTAHGVPRLQVAEWKVTERLQEATCGAFYQPYGPVELAHVVALISSLALDVLLKVIDTSTHRIWCAPRSFLERTGGSWTDQWRALVSTNGEGGFTLNRPWEKASPCSFCDE